MYRFYILLMNLLKLVIYSNFMMMAVQQYCTMVHRIDCIIIVVIKLVLPEQAMGWLPLRFGIGSIGDNLLSFLVINRRECMFHRKGIYHTW